MSGAAKKLKSGGGLWAPVVAVAALLTLVLGGCGVSTQNAASGSGGGSTGGSAARAQLTGASAQYGAVTVTWAPYQFPSKQNSGYVVAYTDPSVKAGQLDLGAMATNQASQLGRTDAAATSYQFPWIDPNAFPVPEFWLIPVVDGALVTDAASPPMLFNQAEVPTAEDAASFPNGWASIDATDSVTDAPADTTSPDGLTIEQQQQLVNGVIDQTASGYRTFKAAYPSFANRPPDVTIKSYLDPVKWLKGLRSWYAKTWTDIAAHDNRESLVLSIPTPLGPNGNLVNPVLLSNCSHGHFAGFATGAGTVLAMFDPDEGAGGDTRIQCGMEVQVGDPVKTFADPAVKTTYQPFVSFTVNYDVRSGPTKPEVKDFFDAAGYDPNKLSIYVGDLAPRYEGVVLPKAVCPEPLAKALYPDCNSGNVPAYVKLNLGQNTWAPGVSTWYYNQQGAGSWTPGTADDYSKYAGTGKPWAGDVKGGGTPTSYKTMITRTMISDPASPPSCKPASALQGAADSTGPCGTWTVDRSVGVNPPSGKNMIAYYPNYKNNANVPGYLPITSVPYNRLTGVNYGFAAINNGSAYYQSTNPAYSADQYKGDHTGECVPSDPYADEQKVIWSSDWRSFQGGFNALNKYGKSINPNLKTSLSIGGAAQVVQVDANGNPVPGEVPWGQVTKDSASIQKFVTSCVALANKYGFDGIDVDWEFPTAGDTTNYLAMLQEFRKQLGQAPLTVAGPADPNKVAASGGAALGQAVDWVNVMAYDYYGPWDSPDNPGRRTNMNAPLHPDPADALATPGWSVEGTVNEYLKQGIPAGKIVMGFPFYGRIFNGVPGANSGLYQTYTPPQGQAAIDAAAPSYRQLLPLINNPGYVRTWWNVQQVPTLYNAQSGQFVTYDDPQSIAAKAQFAKDKGLRGGMYWEASGDTPSLDLLTAINKNIG